MKKAVITKVVFLVKLFIFLAFDGYSKQQNVFLNNMMRIIKLGS